MEAASSRFWLQTKLLKSTKKTFKFENQLQNNSAIVNVSKSYMKIVAK